MKFRKPLKITSRTSSLTNSFVQAIIPHTIPSREEVDEALQVLGMTYDNRVCVYCGTPATDWDHLRPLVRKKRPTGYVDNIQNLVPSCGRCNQSKGAADWKAWMQGSARGSPKTRCVPNLHERMDRLDRFERWGNVQPLSLRTLVGHQLWDAHWANLDLIEQKMREAQVHATEMRLAIIHAMNADGSNTRAG